MELEFAVCTDSEYIREHMCKANCVFQQDNDCQMDLEADMVLLDDLYDLPLSCPRRVEFAKRLNGSYRYTEVNIAICEHCNLVKLDEVCEQCQNTGIPF